jgi:hypothetical protein
MGFLTDLAGGAADWFSGGESPLPLGFLDPDDWGVGGAAADGAAGAAGISGAAGAAAAGAAAAFPHYTEDPSLFEELTDEEKKHISPTLNPDAIEVPSNIPRYY